jgi:DNA polymerase-3 subunit epsilon
VGYDAGVLWPSPRWDSVTYWSLDLETGGLDPKRDPILAVGMVPVRAGTVRLGDAFETLVRPDRAEDVRASSVVAHQLVPGELTSAPPLREALEEVDRRLQDGLLLVHQAAFDVPFLKRAYRTAGLRWRSPLLVDTVDLLVRLAKKQRFIDPDAQDREPTLNLSAARRLFGLPDYGAHDALTDAIATAELFLVLRKKIGARTVRDLR